MKVQIVIEIEGKRSVGDESLETRADIPEISHAIKALVGSLKLRGFWAPEITSIKLI